MGKVVRRVYLFVFDSSICRILSTRKRTYFCDSGSVKTESATGLPSFVTAASVRVSRSRSSGGTYGQG
jgi:hypothetical protein